MAINIKLVKSLIGANKNQVAVAKSLDLSKIGDVVTQPDNPATKGKINKISHLVEILSK